VAAEAPTGTVTFLSTDIEGSTRLWEDHGDAMAAALARHDEIARSVFDAHDGYVFATGGDSFAVAFASAVDAVAAAVDCQEALGAEPWDGAVIMVRMGLRPRRGTQNPEGDAQ
jgi:class 3 adenylate cyclase